MKHASRLASRKAMGMSQDIPIKGTEGKRSPPTRRRTPLRLLLMLFAVVAVGALVIAAWNSGRKSLFYDENAISGSSGFGSGNIEQLQELVDKSMITLSINATPVWDLADKEAGVNWQIENPAEQTDKLIRVEIYRDDTEQLIYETGAIPPGSYVTGTKPKRDLSAGKYSCTAYFYGYDIETQEFLGQVGAQILLQVLN